MEHVNYDLTVITVSYNNYIGLKATLDSIIAASCKPGALVVVDGGSDDGSLELLKRYSSLLPQMTFSSGEDGGIYDALNIGKKMVETELVHYLNAGDCLFGDPYKDVNSACLMPVVFYDENQALIGRDSVKLFGTAYNHQGIIFESNHPEFDTNLAIAADYKVICEAFPHGLKNLKIVMGGGVRYLLGGVSSRRSVRGNFEIIRVAFSRNTVRGMLILLLVLMKSAMPRPIRRSLLRLYS